MLMAITGITIRFNFQVIAIHFKIGYLHLSILQMDCSELMLQGYWDYSHSNFEIPHYLYFAAHIAIQPTTLCFLWACLMIEDCTSNVNVYL